MDPHFDPSRSSTNRIKSCGGDNKKCYFKQSYTEGSSWSAFKVRDKVWVGGQFKIDVYNMTLHAMLTHIGLIKLAIMN